METEAAPTRRFQGRVALVTGAATGLGRAIAVRLAREGAAVAVNFAHSEDEAQTTVLQIEALGGASIPVEADVSDPYAVEQMVVQVEQALSPIDILVANAGITEYVPFPDLESVTVELWERILGVNLIGAFLCMRAVAPRMVERGAGSAVLVSSNSPFIVAGSCIPYVVSKSALISLTQCLAKALAPAVQVNGVAPGWMVTPWLDKYLPPERASWVRSGEVPTVDVDRVADLVADLAANSAITGEVVVVDSGELVSRGNGPVS